MEIMDGDVFILSHWQIILIPNMEFYFNAEIKLLTGSSSSSVFDVVFEISWRRTITGFVWFLCTNNYYLKRNFVKHDPWFNWFKSVYPIFYMRWVKQYLKHWWYKDFEELFWVNYFTVVLLGFKITKQGIRYFDMHQCVDF